MKKNSFAPIIIILIIAILGVVGYFIYKNYSTKLSSSTSLALLNSSPSPMEQQPTLQVYVKDNPIFSQNNPHVGDIWVKNIKIGQEKQITSYGFNSHPKLSPDSKWVVYLSWPKEQVIQQTRAVKVGYGGSLTNNVWIIQSDGTNAQQVIKNISSESEVSWSPNSRYFVTLTHGYQIFDIQLMKVISRIEDNDPGMENAQPPVWLDDNRFVYQKAKSGSLDSAPAVYDISTQMSTWQ